MFCLITKRRRAETYRNKNRQKKLHTFLLQPLLLTAIYFSMHWCAAMAMCLTTITIFTMNFLCTCIPYSVVCVKVYSTLLCIIIIISWHHLFHNYLKWTCLPSVYSIFLAFKKQTAGSNKSINYALAHCGRIATHHVLDHASTLSALHSY